MLVADAFAVASWASLGVGADAAVSCRVRWSGGFLAVTVTAEVGVGGTTVVAVVGVGVDDGVGVELWLPASCGAVSLAESYGGEMRKARR